MRINNIHEAINVPPHLPAQWLESVYKKAKQIESRLSDAFIIQEAASVEHRELRDETDYFRELERAYLPYEFRNQLVDKDNLFSHRIAYYEMVMDDSDYWRVAFSRIDMYKEINDENGDLDKWLEVYEGAQDRRYDQQQLQEWSKAGYIEERQYRKLRNGILVSDAIAYYIKFLKEASKKFEAIRERNNLRNFRVRDGVKQLPAHDPVEQLYHATPFVREILNQGFKTKEDLGGTEVMGGVTEGAISFTGDFDIAQSIVDAIKDAIMIAQGTLRLGELISIARSEGINMDHFRSWLTDYKYQKKKVGASDPDIAFEFYRHYLMFTKIKYNPVFFGVSSSNFKNLKIENVGVLVADVDMSKIVNYLQAMEEYRVPVSAISNVRRVY